MAASSEAWRWLRPRAGRAEPPNVVLVLTDDQGYGDLGCHGNPILRTPNIDALHRQSVRLTDFHVGPTCAPTRASLMTGRYCNRTGVWHTIMGRSLAAPGRGDDGRCLRGGGLPHGHLRQMAPGRQLPLPAAGSRIPGGPRPRRRRASARRRTSGATTTSTTPTGTTASPRSTRATAPTSGSTARCGSSRPIGTGRSSRTWRPTPRTARTTSPSSTAARTRARTSRTPTSTA